MKKRILIVCTGNSCRSQMAEGFLRSFDGELEIFSAGTRPERNVNPYAIRVMQEKGIDLSARQTNDISEYVKTDFDYVITVCDQAKEQCPVFTGKVDQRLHIGFEDPADAHGTEEEVLAVYRKVRDQIQNEFYKFYQNIAMNNEDLKKMVRDKYAEIAKQSKTQNESSCCGVGSSCCGVDYTVFSESYDHLKGYNPDADLGLGCGIPTEYAGIKTGDTVIDLGSGAGNDCFVVRELVGESGHVIGIDFTEEMIQKARVNAEKLRFNNVEFRQGDIEKMPVTANKADVVISNCVLNLVPDKVQAFREIYRVLKPGGHFSVSDVVLKGALPSSLKGVAEMYAGCVSGAIQKQEYLDIIQQTGFTGITLHKEREIRVPDEILLQYISPDELARLNAEGNGIFSITVFAEKPLGCGCNGAC